MDDYICNDDGEWGGAEPSCLFGFDLNVPLTSNKENIYEIRAEQPDPTDNGDDGDVLDVEELVNEDHLERDKITDNVQYGVDVENNNVAENGVDDNNGGRVNLCRYDFRCICTVLIVVQIMFLQKCTSSYGSS
ncbi:unnamed protein product [Linum trigynum]|uniref:Sushi domain-containing protein n=1 Tax=Linum trigynum TaxID=586398 RepID=A0AAV2G4P0_9ROSI